MLIERGPHQLLMLACFHLALNQSVHAVYLLDLMDIMLYDV